MLGGRVPSNGRYLTFLPEKKHVYIGNKCNTSHQVGGMFYSIKKTVHDSHIVPVFYVVLRLPDV